MGVVGLLIELVQGELASDVMYRRMPLGRATGEGESPVFEMRSVLVLTVPEYRGARGILRESGRTTFQG